MRSIHGLIAVAAAVGMTAAIAQTMQRDDANVPQGSPVRGDRSESRSSQPAQMVDPTGGGKPFEPTTIIDSDRSLLNFDQASADRRGLLDTTARLKPSATPGEFESHVARVLGRPLPRFGADLLLPGDRDFATPATATVPPDYVLNVGDVVAIAMTGSVEGSVQREIDTDGKIFLPKVGSIQLAGLRYGDLHDTVAAALGRQYRGYTVTVGIGRLRGLRVYVTGFANNPGAFTVSSLSTIANAVFSAGGPSSGGSFRSVKLYRRGAEVADFDLYELVRGGSRINDAVLQNEDVLFIPPAGPQIAVVGSVQQEAIYEGKPGETLETMLGYAGGPNSLGDASRLILYRSSEQDRVGPQQIDRQNGSSVSIAGGDILQILSRGTLTQPIDRQSVLVRIEGEVNRPGNYYVPPNTPLSDVLAKAGGLTPRAFAFGTKLQRTSVRTQQRESFADAIRQLELTLAAGPLTADQTQSAGERQTQLASAREVMERLRQAEPDGRVVLDISPQAATLPGAILLENNDHIIVPPRASTVGVFGAVYRPASFLLNEAKPVRVREYIDRAGGSLRAADPKGIFVVRANGEVLSKRRGALGAHVLPGDVIFVPVKTQSGSFWTKLREISTVLFQVALSAATVSTVTR